MQLDFSKLPQEIKERVKRIAKPWWPQSQIDTLAQTPLSLAEELVSAIENNEDSCEVPRSDG